MRHSHFSRAQHKRDRKIDDHSRYPLTIKMTTKILQLSSHFAYIAFIHHLHRLQNLHPRRNIHRRHNIHRYSRYHCHYRPYLLRTLPG